MHVHCADILFCVYSFLLICWFCLCSLSLKVNKIRIAKHDLKENSCQNHPALKPLFPLCSQSVNSIWKFKKCSISPCSCQMCGTSARCRRWPRGRGLVARRTAWTRAGWADPTDTQSWTSCTRGASPPPAGRPQCFLLSYPSHSGTRACAEKTAATLCKPLSPMGLLWSEGYPSSQSHNNGTLGESSSSWGPFVAVCVWGWAGATPLCVLLGSNHWL